MHGRLVLVLASFIGFACWPSLAQAQSPWMGELLDDPVVGEQFAQTRLSDVVFPGTHDSGTYNLNGAEVPIADELAADDLLLASAMSLAVTFGAGELVAEAQDRTVGQQLADGVRAIDIRTYYDMAEGEVRVTHTFKGPSLDEILADLAAFVSDPANDREIIVFQFSYKSADVARTQIPGLNEAVYRQIFDYPVSSGETLGDKFIPWDVGDRRHWMPRFNPVSALLEYSAVSDPTVEQALATGGQIIFTGPRWMYEAYQDPHAADVYAKMWESPDRGADFYGALANGEYPSWFEMNTEGRAFDLMSLVAAERAPLYREDGQPAPSSHRYLSSLGLHSGVNVVDLQMTLIFGNPWTLFGYAELLNPEIVPQIASLPRDQVNIVELDYYRDWMTPWFVALNRGVVRVETGPYGASPSDSVFGETTALSDASGPPDFYPIYTSGLLGQAVFDLFGTSPLFVPESVDSYHPDVGGGEYVSVSDRRYVTLGMTEAVGYWDHNRFAEVHSSTPEHLFVAAAEDDLSGDDYVTIDPVWGGWSYHVDLRAEVDAAVGPAGSSYDSGMVTASGNVAYAANQGEHAAIYLFQHTLCEWGINCPEDDPQVIDPWDIGVPGFPFLSVPEGGSLDLSGVGHDSQYSSAVAALYWDTSPDGPPYDHRTPSEGATFDATGLAPGVYPISLAIVRTATDVPGVLDSLVYDIHVCTDADGDGETDGGPNTFVCPDLDDDDDNDTVLDELDVCPGFDDTLDGDSDGVPDGCDLCTGEDTSGDTDDDGVCDDLDACADEDDGLDADSDAVPDACDVCANADDMLDDDSDGVPDGCDLCAGADDALDADDDGVADGCDLCADADDALDADSDGVPDACDACPGFDDGADGDGDGVADGCDACLGDDGSGNADGDANCDDLDDCPGFDDDVDADGNGVADGCEVSDPSTPSNNDASEGCGCATGSPSAPLAIWLPLALLALRRGRTVGNDARES